MNMHDAITSMDLVEGLFEREDPEQQRRWLMDMGFDSSAASSSLLSSPAARADNASVQRGGGLSWAHHIWMTAVKNMTVRRFRHTGLSVVDDQESKEAAAEASSAALKQLPCIILAKYPNEDFTYLREHNFGGYPRSFPDGTVLRVAKGAGGTGGEGEGALFFMEDNRKREIAHQLLQSASLNTSNAVEMSEVEAASIATGSPLTELPIDETSGQSDGTAHWRVSRQSRTNRSASHSGSEVLRNLRNVSSGWRPSRNRTLVVVI
eukprot:gene33849-39473_t